MLQDLFALKPKQPYITTNKFGELQFLFTLVFNIWQCNLTLITLPTLSGNDSYRAKFNLLPTGAFYTTFAKRSKFFLGSLPEEKKNDILIPCKILPLRGKKIRISFGDEGLI